MVNEYLGGWSVGSEFAALALVIWTKRIVAGLGVPVSVLEHNGKDLVVLASGTKLATVLCSFDKCTKDDIAKLIKEVTIFNQWME